jgi:sporulation protein YlmC with PRC-barrel domain
MRSTMTTTLEPLSQSHLQLADPGEDLRGKKVVDRDGQDLGKVDDAFIDVSERRIRFFTVKTGDILGVGGKSFLVPVDAISSFDGDRIVLSETRDRFVGGPEYHGSDGVTPKATLDDQDAQALYLTAYEWYDVDQPYWSPTYRTPSWR